MFENCTCVSSNLASQLFNTTPQYMNTDLTQLTFDLSINGTAKEGRCDQGCNLIGPFLVVIGIALFLIFMLQVPYVIITVRYRATVILILPCEATRNVCSYSIYELYTRTKLVHVHLYIIKKNYV